MNLTSLPIVAQQVAHTSFEFGRIQSEADYVLPVAVFVAVGLFVWAMYRRDAVELRPLLAGLLVALRTATFLGLLILYLQPQWRTEYEVVRNSRALLLVDTSLSMGLGDEPAAGEDTRSRAEQVADVLAQGKLLEQLRRMHEVLVFRFDEGLGRDRVVLDKLGTGPAVEPMAEDSPQGVAGVERIEPPDGREAGGELRSTADTQASATAQTETIIRGPVDWHKFLAPKGTQTQLGAALSQLINDQRGSPLSGIVVLSDGGQNAGIAPEAAVDLARNARIPVFTVGVGSAREPINVRVSDLVAPARAYPGDGYVVTGYVQAQGMAGQSAEVQLLSRVSGPGSGSSGGGEQVLSTHQVILGPDGEPVPVRFELTSEETGRRTLFFRVQAPPEDRNPADNQREAEIEIVDRKNRVLLMAGGPTRDYRFLRTLLFRDRSTVLDVLLQTAQPGISQEADKLLDQFPKTPQEMFVYDCLVAFDPDWQALSVDQVKLLETWVAEKGGGLIVVAGPVFSGGIIGGWVEDRNMAGIRALYPVEFPRRFSVLEDRRHTTAEPWPLEFTREGLEAEYLWLEDTAAAGREAWASFPGVYSFCPVRGPKQGATVLARFSDPRTAASGELPVFLAEQFYGSGKVFYIGSGEMWRLRRLDPAYFERLYTKLIRHVSQGRLLRQSTRGVLLVGRERYLIGNAVELQAQLTDVRLEPLDAPEVLLQVICPDGSLQTVTLQSDPGRVGTYAGRFPVTAEGPYLFDLAVPESEGEHLTRRVHVEVPDLERENPQRNDALLGQLARRSTIDAEEGGVRAEYYVGLAEMLNPPPPKRPLAELLKDRTQTVVLTAAPDPLWQRTWLMWMMLTLCGLLCLEWLIRRLAKLA